MVRPNFDTLYSLAWLDLTAGPVILHAPDTDDRYYMLPLLDMWTDVFANPGKRTTGTDAQDFVITGPGYTGELPDGCAGDRGAHTVRVDHRPHPDQRPGGLRRGPQGAGRLQHHPGGAEPVRPRRRRGLRHQHRAARNWSTA